MHQTQRVRLFLNFDTSVSQSECELGHRGVAKQAASRHNLAKGLILAVVLQVAQLRHREELLVLTEPDTQWKLTFLQVAELPHP